MNPYSPGGLSGPEQKQESRSSGTPYFLGGGLLGFAAYKGFLGFREHQRTAQSTPEFISQERMKTRARHEGISPKGRTPFGSTYGNDAVVPDGIGGHSPRGLESMPTPIEQLNLKGTTLTRAQADRAYDMYKLASSGIATFRDTLEQADATTIYSAQGISDKIEFANKNFYRGISTRAPDISLQNLDRLFFAGIKASSKAIKDPRAGMLSFIKREQAMVPQLAGFAETIATGTSGVDVRLAAKNYRGLAPEMGLQVGKEFVSFGGALGTQMGFGRQTLQGPQLIMRGIKNQAGKMTGIGLVTAHELMAERVGAKLGELKGLGESAIASKLRGVVADVTSIFSQVGDVNASRRIERGARDPITMMAMQRGRMVIADPGLAGELGINPWDSPKKTLGQMSKIFSNRDLVPPEVAKLIFGTTGDVTAQHILYRQSDGIKGKDATRLMFDPIVNPSTIAFSGKYGAADNLGRELHELSRSVPFILPSGARGESRAGEIIRQSYGKSFNKFHGFSATATEQAQAGVAAGGQKGTVASITGDVMYIQDVRRVTKQGEKIGQDFAEGLGLQGSSAGSGQFWMSGDVAKLQTPQNADFSLYGGKDQINELFRKYEKGSGLVQISQKELRRRNIGVRTIGKEGTLPHYKGDIWVDPQTFKKGTGHMTAVGQTRKGLDESGMGIRLALEHLSGSRTFTELNKRGPRPLMAAAFRGKDESLMRGIMATVQRAAEETDITMNSGIREAVQDLAGDVLGKNAGKLGTKGSINRALGDFRSELLSDLRDRGIETSSLERMKRKLQADLKYDVSRVRLDTGEEYEIGGIRMAQTAYGRPETIAAETKMFGDLMSHRNKYRAEYGKFTKQMEKIANRGESDAHAKYAQQFLELENVRFSTLQYLKEGGASTGEILVANEGMARELRSILGRMDEQGPINMGARKGKTAFSQGSLEGFNALERIQEQLEYHELQNLQAKPMQIKPTDFMMMSMKARESGNWELWDYFTTMQKASKERVAHTQAMQGLAPFIDVDPDVLIKQATKEGGAGFFGAQLDKFGKRSPLVLNMAKAKDVEAFQTISGAMMDLKHDMDNIEPGKKYTEAMMHEMFKREGHVERFRAAGFMDPHDLLGRSLAITGLDEGTLNDITVKNVAKDGGTYATKLTSKSRSLIIPSMLIGGRMWSKGPGHEALEMNKLRSSILGMYDGLHHMYSLGGNNEVLNNALGNFVEAVAEQSTKTGLTGQAVNLKWKQSAYSHILPQPEATTRAIARETRALDKSFAASEAATVFISKEQAERWRYGGLPTDRAGKTLPNQYAMVTGYPILGPSEQRVVKVRVSDRYKGKEMGISFGLSASAARDFDADKLGIAFLGDQEEISAKLRSIGMSKGSAEAEAKRLIGGISKTFKSDALGILELHTTEMEIANRMKTIGAETWLNTQVHNDVDRNVLVEAFARMHELHETGKDVQLSDSWIQAKYKEAAGKGGSNVLGTSTLKAFTQKVTAATTLGKVSNDIMRIQWLLSDYSSGLRTSPLGTTEGMSKIGDKQMFNIAMQLLHQPTQAGISTRTKGIDIEQASSVQLIDMIMGNREDGRAALALGKADRNKMKDLIRDALTPGEVYAPGSTTPLSFKEWSANANFANIKERTHFVARDKGIYTASEFKRFIDMKTMQIDEDALENLTDLFFGAARDMRTKKENFMSQNAEFLNSAFNTKAGYGDAAAGAFTPEGLLEGWKSLLQRRSSLGAEGLAELGFMQQYLDDASGSAALREAYGGEVMSTMRRALEEEIRAAGGDPALDAAKASLELGGTSTGLLDRMLDKVDSVFEQSPKAKWLLGATALGAAAIVGGRMLTGDPELGPSGPRPTAPPAMPSGKPEHSTRPVDTGGSTYMEPSYSMADRFIANGGSPDPEIAGIMLRQNTAGEGSFAISDSSLNGAQFGQELAMATSGRF